MVRDASILILDELSSGLDAESERLVFEGLARLLAGKTTFVIAHRLATIKKADIILVPGPGPHRRARHARRVARAGRPLRGAAAAAASRRNPDCGIARGAVDRQAVKTAGFGSASEMLE
jgi:ABC-type protease/lipase transport system fused ATPase/permease subunit